MDALAYLRRIGLDGAPAPSIEALRALQRTHLQHVPFENASVLRGEPIILATPSLVEKIVQRGRGGFCFELNGAFAWLLGRLGFDAALLPGQFWSSTGLGPPNEHLALRVVLDGEPWLVDVGAGYSFLEPLRLEVGVAQDDPTGRFRLSAASGAPDAIDVEWQHADGDWRPHYRFEDRPVALDAFVEVCEHLCTSPDSPFTKGWICARALPDGWATLDVALVRWFGVPAG
jgi:N-hydroxyarylamine O-acetyltransferase